MKPVTRSSNQDQMHLLRGLIFRLYVYPDRSTRSILESNIKVRKMSGIHKPDYCQNARLRSSRLENTRCALPPSWLIRVD